MIDNEVSLWLLSPHPPEGWHKKDSFCLFMAFAGLHHPRANQSFYKKSEIYMKLQSAFKLSALAVALASTSVAFAATLNTSELGNDVWTDPRGPQVGNVDQAGYQYVDVGSKATTTNLNLDNVTNKLTEWYHLDDLSAQSTDAKNILKVTDIATNTVQYYALDDADLAALAGLDQQGLIDHFNNQTSSSSIVQLNNLTELEKLSADQLAALSDSKTKPVLAGLTKTSDLSQTSTALIRRLDSNYLEYADEKVTTESKMVAEGNLTNDDKVNSLVLANVDTQVPVEVKKTTTNDSVKTGYVNDVFNAGQIAYGVAASKTTTVNDLLAKTTNVTEQSTTLTSEGIKVVEKTSSTTAETVITANGITTGSLTVGGVDVGQALGNASILGNLSAADMNTLVNSGQTLTALQDDVKTLDNRVTSEVERLDGRIDAELAANASASTAYTDKKVSDTATELRAEAAVESTRVDQAISAGDAATLASANTYTDTAVSNITNTANTYTDVQIAGVNTRVNQLNKRIDDVEKTSYRGIAIALAAQQQIPNIGAGQFAVFGGVGHYEGESAAALGLASVLADGRTAFSAALGFAGGNEVGGRVGVSYVFGGK